MRLIVETIEGTRYLDIPLTPEDLDKLNTIGVCKEFEGTELGNLVLNVFIHPEEIDWEKFHAAQEGIDIEDNF